jgi:muramidase (phage lysozyme)
MEERKWQAIGDSTMTPVNDKQRKEVFFTPKEYSVQADLSDFIGMNPETGKAVETLPYEFRTKGGDTILKGKTDTSGDTARVMTREEKDVLLYVGSGAWKLSTDSSHGIPTPTTSIDHPDEPSTDKQSDSSNSPPNDDAFLDVTVIDMHGDPIADLLIKILVEKQEIFKGKTDAKGNIPRIEHLKPGSHYEIRVKKDKAPVDKNRADADGFMFAGVDKIYSEMNCACLSSPKNKFVLRTEMHLGAPGGANKHKEKAIQTHNQKPAEKPEITGNPDKKPEVQADRDDKGLPKAVVVDGQRDWFDRNNTNGGTSRASKDELEHVTNVIAFGKKQALWRYPTPSTHTIITSMTAKKFNEPTTAKPISQSAERCNVYVKVALWVAGYSETKDEIGPGITPAADMGPALIAAKFRNITTDIPDPRWAAPGDVIVYKWTKEELARRQKKAPGQANMGHIDIRTYDGYLSDFLGERLPDARKFEVTGIYRKYQDPLPDLRVKAMLEIIASRETKGIPKDQSWYALNTPINGNKFAASIQKHPWFGLELPDSIKKGKTSTAAGRYQLTLTAWKEARDVYLFSEDFSPPAQMRLAVLRMEYRKALGLIREGKIEAGVRALTSEWVALPGGVDAKDYTMAQLLSEHENLMKELAK